MIEVVSILKDFLGIIDKDDKNCIPFTKDTKRRGLLRTDESHPASRYPLRKEEEGNK